MNAMTVFLQGIGGGGNMSFIIMMVAIFAIMYFFMIRPQNKKQKAIRDFRANLTVGQDIMTAGGIYGKIKEIDDATSTVMLEIASGVKIKMDKNSIYQDAAAIATNGR